MMEIEAEAEAAWRKDRRAIGLAYFRVNDTNTRRLTRNVYVLGYIAGVEEEKKRSKENNKKDGGS